VTLSSTAEGHMQGTDQRTAYACQACGSSSEPRLCYRKSGYPIRRCNECGLGSTGLSADFDPTGIYSRGYFSGGQNDGYADYPGSEPVLRKEFRSALRRLKAAGRSDGKLFEIGCAYGFFLLEATRTFQVSGIEMCEEAADHCRRRGLDVSTGFAAEEELARKGPFDAVVMLDVIEHLPDPWHVLCLAHRHLSPGGHLMITTGDWESIASRVMGPSWRLMTPPQHVFFFSRKNIHTILARAGFRVLELTRPGKLVPVNLALYQMLRILGVKPRTFPLLNNVGIPINLFDAMCVIAVRE
jgi:SAM-dependent methyltransferase